MFVGLIPFCMLLLYYLNMLQDVYFHPLMKKGQLFQVCCKEMRKAEMVVLSGSSKERTTIEELSNSNICYSIEIINSIIPPWVICGICAAMIADGTSFDSMYGQLSLSLFFFFEKVAVAVILLSLCLLTLSLQFA
jgi:hypothetical protein